MEAKKEIQKKELATLISTYGDEIIDRVIRDCNKKSILIWGSIYELSTDYARDIKLFIELEAKEGLAYYLSKMPQAELKNLLNEYSDKELFIEAFPYNKSTIVFINGNENEALFWRSHAVSIVDNMDFEYIFNKYIKFAPENLIEFFAYRYKYDYQHGIALLKRIAEKGLKKQESEWDNNQYHLIKIINDMDKEHYTKELFICEFKLLPYLREDLEYCPMGVKQYFWDNPTDFGNFIIGLKDSLNSNRTSPNRYFYFNLIANDCLIPREYLWQKKSELKNWTNAVLTTIDCKDKETCKRIKNAIINILGCYPCRENDDIWPCVEIADIIESISKKDYDDRFEVSKILYCSYVGRKGVHIVNDGSAERVLSELFKVYSEKYRYSHPVVSKALEYISNAYFEEYERDKEYSTTGKF